MTATEAAASWLPVTTGSNTAGWLAKSSPMAKRGSSDSSKASRDRLRTERVTARTPNILVPFADLTQRVDVSIPRRWIGDRQDGPALRQYSANVTLGHATTDVSGRPSQRLHITICPNPPCAILRAALWRSEVSSSSEMIVCMKPPLTQRAVLRRRRTASDHHVPRLLSASPFSNSREFEHDLVQPLLERRRR